ncbi:MAG: cyclase [Alteromonadaceae bacterium]|uniref:cyclase family protein n=1 Tax=Paraglaciecola chathamensis TaxID=368405 RepID=UPI000C5486A0|nr:cyclase family protein [Paraglaciecola agarilytica]MBN23834.1 cyclase [Alteromonadaceae bacterium]|tara:strand:+ start:65326 stop:66318 length:993 start_codon:yes stop_codon:yes gene_type:complete
MKLLMSALLAVSLQTANAEQFVGTSPWGKHDEIGRLNMMTPQRQAQVMSQIDAHRIFDLSVEYFVGMPSWQAARDPHYQFWMTHTPRGAVIDNVLDMGETVNRHVSYSGSAFSMYTHTGTHIDTLSHFGLDGEIYNHFSADENLGDKGWNRSGAETIPPLIARGVLIDLPKAKGLSMLPDNYRVTEADIKQALAQQYVTLQPGDIVLLRTGRMQNYAQSAKYMANSPGLGIAAATYLAKEAEAMVVGADNLSFEAFPSEVEGNYVPVHTYLLTQMGVPIIELVNLEELAEAQVYEFAFIGGSLKLRGADAAPLRPIAFPLKTAKKKPQEE